jgi:hypothetical protein
LDSKKYGQKNHFAEVSDRRSRVGVRNDEPRDNEKKVYTLILGIDTQTSSILFRTLVGRTEFHLNR